MSVPPQLRRLEHLLLRGALRPRRPDATVVPAFAAGVGMGAPLLFLFALGRIDLLVFAAFGGFTSLYGRNEPYAVRAPMLAAVGLFLTSAVVAGTAVAALVGNVVVSIVVVAVFAGLSKLLADAARVGPPAGLMPVFAIAVCAELPVDGSAIPVAALTSGLAAAWCWLVCMSGYLIRHHGPERIAVARALEAVAERVVAIGTELEPTARHRAGVALQRAWQVLASAKVGVVTGRLEALCAYAETAMERSRHAHERAVGRGDPDAEVPEVVDTGTLLRLASQLRGFGRTPSVPPSRSAETDLAERQAAAAILTEPSALLTHPASPSSLRHMSRTPVVRRWGSTLRDLRLSSPYVPLALRVLVAALIGSVVAHAAGLGHTSWAAVSAAAVLQSVNTVSTLHRGIQRAVGTGFGLLIGVALLWVAPEARSAIVLVIIFQVLAELTVMVNYAFALVFATPVALLLAHVGHAIPVTTLARDRLLDTLVGAVIGVLVAVAIPNHRLGDALREAMRQAEVTLRRGRDLLAEGEQPEQLAAGRDLALALQRMRSAYDAASGEPSPEDLPAESFRRLEHEGFAVLARLTS
ncbi:MAG TPA: FUSC family protein [Segeticoccus sp.]|uniref:FUSC family protein n=1 Tax=Segeticoccus sp. TaxID=2706531 RepID=UPI002D807428|nr:FUSC family protein [Segeticoccus sp.]HET8601210.1 FUSC family protein [Segeticoccus sp.]